MGVTGAKGNIFLGFNFLFWLLGLGTLGYGIWILISSNNTNHFLSGTLVFTYSFLGIGLLVGITGLLGCIGGCAESTCCLKVYIGLVVTILFIDIGVAVASYVERDNVFGIMDKLWDEINTDTKGQIQKELKCCGFESATEYGTKIPDSCYSNTDDVSTIYTVFAKCDHPGIPKNEYLKKRSGPTEVNQLLHFENIHMTSCETAMKDWVEDNIPIWASVLGAIGLVQIICLICSCVVLTSIEKAMRVSDFSGD